MRLSTRSIVVTGMLGAIAIVLGASGIGSIPVPTIAAKVTIMHIPAILAGIIEGPVVGAFVGLIFGLYSNLWPASAMAADPLVAIIPRILIGIVSYYVYAFTGKNTTFGSILAAIAGTLTNTAGFLGMAVVRGYIPSWYAAGSIAVIHGIPEAIVASIIVFILVKALKRSYLKF